MRIGEITRHTGPNAKRQRDQPDPQQHVERPEQRRWPASADPTNPAATTQTAKTRASARTVQRVTRASTSVVSAVGSGWPGSSRIKPGRRHANATKAKVNVNAHAAPTIA